MVLDLRGRQQQAARGTEVIAATFAAPGNDDDTVAAATLSGLDHEAVVRGDDARKLAHLTLIATHAIEIGDGHPGIERQLFGLHLVVHPREKASGIAPHDELGVALIEPQHPAAAESCGSTHHDAPDRALKRPNSSRR